MDLRVVLKLLGHVLIFEALFMLVAAAPSLAYGGWDFEAIMFSVGVTAAFGLALSKIFGSVESAFQKREGFVTVSLAWISLALFGALPYYFAGVHTGFVDCFFESVSGFTGTGLSVFSDLDILPKGVLFWRSFTNWLGGMGVLVMVLAIMPSLRPSAINLLHAESSGPSPGKIVPRIRDTAKIMYKIYVALTLAQIFALFIAGMPIYDAILNTFASAGTGGFSPQNASIGAYNSIPIEVVTGIFIILFGINFSLLFCLTQFDFKSFFADEELRLYLFVIGGAVLLITVDLISVYGGVGKSLRYAFFQVATISSTSGFVSTSLTDWPSLSKAILLCLMVFGSCAGSTGGGVKILRVLVAIKSVRHEITKILHPRLMKNITVNKKTLDTAILNNIYVFFFLFASFVVAATFLVALDTNGLTSAFLVVLSSVSNVGVDINVFGASLAHSATFSGFSKFVLSVCMLAGRLEFFPVMILFVPSVWRKG
ncbi:potassium transporter KefA [Clostridia bacterium]|nr:potassium transporter KefA [Clostridia bacterium]